MNAHHYVKGHLIAHAGGGIGTRRYSNSREALERSREYVGLIEFDVCRASDGLIVAHDGLESRYGIDGKFSDRTVDEFRNTRFCRSLHPMSVRDLISILPESSACAILDIKSVCTADYGDALEEIAGYCDEFGVRDKTIIQVYSPDDFACTQRLGLDNIILALWKNYYDIRSQRCRDCITLCFAGEPRGFRALSMRSIYFWEGGGEAGEDIVDYFFERSPMIFVHGQEVEIEEYLLDRGFGLFTHNPQRLLAHLEKCV